MKYTLLLSIALLIGHQSKANNDTIQTQFLNEDTSLIQLGFTNTKLRATSYLMSPSNHDFNQIDLNYEYGLSNSSKLALILKDELTQAFLGYSKKHEGGLATFYWAVAIGSNLKSQSSTYVEPNSTITTNKSGILGFLNIGLNTKVNSLKLGLLFTVGTTNKTYNYKLNLPLTTPSSTDVRGSNQKAEIYIEHDSYYKPNISYITASPYTQLNTTFNNAAAYSIDTCTVSGFMVSARAFVNESETIELSPSITSFNKTSNCATTEELSATSTTVVLNIYLK